MIGGLVLTAVFGLSLRVIVRTASQNHHESPRLRVWFWLTVYSLVVVAMFATVILGFSYYDEMRRLASEDGPVEWTTFWLLVGAAVFFAADFLAKRPQQFRGFSLVMAVFCLGVAGEEIAWAQRVFDLDNPEFFAQNNVQSEMTIHNLQVGSVRLHGLGQVLIPPAALLMYLAALVLLPNQMRRYSGVGVSGPGLGIAVLFCAYFFLSSYSFGGNDLVASVPLSEAPFEFFRRHSSVQSELSEMFLAGLLLFLAVVLESQRSQSAPEQHRVPVFTSQRVRLAGAHRRQNSTAP